MDNTITFEFQSLYSNDGEMNFDFNAHPDHEDTYLQVTAMQGKDAVVINYDRSFYQDSGEVDSSSLEFIKYYDYYGPDLAEQFSDIFENDLVIKKVEFDRENDKLVTARVEFEADTEGNAVKVKNKAKAYGLKVK
ncbi:MAG: hypothetical protein ACR5LA_00095 [Wolbachia sp.]